MQLLLDAQFLAIYSMLKWVGKEFFDDKQMKYVYVYTLIQ